MDIISSREIKKPLLDIINANTHLLTTDLSKLPEIIRLLDSNDMNVLPVLNFCLHVRYCVKQPPPKFKEYTKEIRELINFESMIENIAYNVASKLIKLDKGILSNYQGNLSTEDKTNMLRVAICNGIPKPLIELILEYGADPNITDTLDSNYIGFLIRNNNPSLIKLLLKYGANPLFNCEGKNFYETPIYQIFDSCDEELIKLICEYPSTFQYLENIIDQLEDNKYLKKIIYNQILNNGMIQTLQYLNDDNIKIYTDFVLWLESIKQIKSLLTREQLYSIYYPLQQMQIKPRGGNRKMFSMIRKITLFKYNLECMIGLPITHPKYMYYDHVIIILFLIRNPLLINLNSDVLKLICYNLFC